MSVLLSDYRLLVPQSSAASEADPMRGRKVLVLLSIAAQLALPGCGGVISPSENQISEFTGTIEPFGDDEHEFQVSRNGEFDIRLTALDPSTGIVLQVLLAQFSGNTCSVFRGVNLAGLNTIALTGAITTGRYCVVVFDEGVITGPVNYTVRVSHP
jgi:hypothetical protein